MPYSSPTTVDIEAARPCLSHSHDSEAKNHGLLTSGPPRLRGDHSDAFFSCVVCVLLKYIIGVALSALIFGIVVAVLPVVLLLRLCLFLKNAIQGTKSVMRWQSSNCHIWYPLENADNPESLGVFIFHSTIDVIDLCTHLAEGYQKRGVEKFYCSHTHITDLARQRTSTWDQNQSNIQTTEDLHHYLNKDSSPSTTEKVPSRLTLISNFAVNENNGSHSLCLLRHRITDEEPICLLRLFTAFSRPPTCRDKSTFDIDPKFCVPLESRVLITWYISQKIAQFFKCLFVGPLSLFSLLLRRRSPIWKHLSSETDRYSTIRRNGDSSHSEDNQMLMMSLPSSVPTERAYCWGQLPLHDEFQRSERVLRAPSIIIYLGLVAGTLRNYFREQGIRHPPDISCTFPFSLQQRASVEHLVSCDCVLLPIYLPTGVEGCIPRIWATQRRMSDVVNSALSMSLKTARKIMGVTLTTKVARKICSKFYEDCGVLVSVIKAKGEPHIQSNRLRSALLFPSLPPNVNIALTFVHCGTETMLSISANRLCFPQPERILQLFQEEMRNLVSQLSVRLMTFAQATVLPMRMSPCSFIFPGSMSPSPLMDHNNLLAQETEFSEESDEMMRSLETLLEEVQAELDELSSESVEGDRNHYIEKLKDLEKRMGAFHERLRERIESSMPGTCKIGFDATRASDTIASLLESYRQPSLTYRQANCSLAWEDLRSALLHFFLNFGKNSQSLALLFVFHSEDSSHSSVERK
uniref:WS_DGAT_C domain-containing protein n=1 Tax=Steinernema glaseri TaxID=37863 RepID=A0A1I7Y2Y5_9BILA